jgi:hypothetical protein
MTNMTDATVIERFRQVGGVPRHIFLNDEDFADVLEAQLDAVSSLTENQVSLIVQKRWNAVQTMSDKAPKSLVTGYQSLGKGYRKPNVVIIADCVFNTIVTFRSIFFGTK